MGISENIQKIKKELPKEVTLVAVSKSKPISDILQAYNSGQLIFGENKVQELLEKYKKLPKDIQWHMIGHLQTNKVKQITPFVSLIHGVDTKKLLIEIDKRAKQNNRIIDCLLQMHIAEEQTKFGFSKQEIEQIIQEQSIFSNINIIGLMGMATFTSDETQIEKEFNFLSSIFKKYNQLTTLSIGMSGDYKIAIKCGSNMLRIGSTIFGIRN